jgi:hypothetical protein
MLSESWVEMWTLIWESWVLKIFGAYSKKYGKSMQKTAFWKLQTPRQNFNQLPTKTPVNCQKTKNINIKLTQMQTAYKTPIRKFLFNSEHPGPAVWT